MTAAELRATHRRPTPQTLGDLPASTWLRVAHVELGTVCHLSHDQRAAVCGAPTGWAVWLVQAMRLHGELCPDCVAGLMVDIREGRL